MASRLFMSVVVVATTALATTAAWAAGCTGDEQFSDPFTQANDPSWPVPRDDIAIGGGKLQGTAPAGKENWALTQAVPVGDADICVDMAVSPVSNPDETLAGLDFWVVDVDNYYSVLIAPNGQASVARILKKKLLWPVSWRKAPSLKTGAGVVNSVRLTLKGNTMSIYFNDQPFYTALRASQPKDGGEWGFDYSSEKAAPNVWTFTNLKVTDPPK